MAPRLFAPLASIAIALAAAPAGSSAVVVVAPAGAAFSEIQPALDAAAPWDVVLVKSGTYARFTISNKAIAVVADAGATVAIAGPIHVHSLGLGKVVVLAGLDAEGLTSPLEPDGYGLLVTFSSGSVRVQDCHLRGADGNALASGCAKAAFDWGWDGARVYQSADVTFTRCTLEGGRGADEFEPSACSGVPATGPSGGDGLRGNNSTVAAHDCVLAAGRGGDAWQLGGFGGHAAHANLGSLFLANCVLAGANGGDAGGAGPGAAGGAGGSAVRCEASTLARVLDCSLEPAASGVAPAAPNSVSAPAFAGAGAILALPGVARSLDLPGVLRGGDPVLLQLDGAAGDAALLFAAPLPASVFAPAGAGQWLLGSLGLVGPLFLGVADGAGHLALAAAAPALPAGVQALGVHLQAAASAQSGGAALTGTSHLTLLPAGS